MTLLLLGMVGSAWALDGQAGYAKGFVIKDGDAFDMKIGGRVQPRYVFESDGDFEELGSHFEITRARLKVSGHAMDPRVSYMMQIDMGKGDVTLKDYWVTYNLTDSVYFQAGQFKRIASRQQIASTSAIHLVERAITDKAFGYGRDVGLLLAQDFDKDGGVEWAIGLYNGSGEKGHFSGAVEVDPTTGVGEVTSGKFSNVPGMFGPQLVLRVGAANSDDGYKENDLGGGGLRWAVGGGTMMLFDADDTDDGNLIANIDYIVKANGFSHTGAVYAALEQDGDAYSDLAYSLLGFHAQAGYVIKGKVEPAARYAMLIPAADGEDNTTELGAGVNVYFKGHNWKWQTDVNSVTTGDERALLGRSQLQLAW